MPWVPGQSGNPKGRPAIGEALSVVVRAKAPPEWIVEKVIDLANDAADERVRLAALQFLTERGYGKVATVIEATDPNTARSIDWRLVPEERRRALMAALAEVDAITEASHADDTAEPH